MINIRIAFIIALSLGLASCATTRPKYRFNNQAESYCKSTGKYKEREKTPLRNFLDHYTYHLSIYKKNDKSYLLSQLPKYNMEFIQYKDTITVILPTDEYFEINSAKLNELRYVGLNNLVNLINLYPCTTVHIAAFTDNVRSRQASNQFTNGQAEALLAYFWANDIPADYLDSQAYGSRFAIGDNHTAHGSAMNRRIEVQWTVHPDESLGNVDLSMK